MVKKSKGKHRKRKHHISRKFKRRSKRGGSVKESTLPNITPNDTSEETSTKSPSSRVGVMSSLLNNKLAIFEKS